MPDEFLTTAQIQEMIAAATAGRPTADEVRRMLDETTAPINRRLLKTESDVLAINDKLDPLVGALARLERNLKETLGGLFKRTTRIDYTLNTTLRDINRRTQQIEETMQRHTDEMAEVKADRDRLHDDLWGDDTNRPSIATMFAELRDGQKGIATRLTDVERSNREREIRAAERQRLLKVVADLPWPQLITIVLGGSAVGTLLYGILQGLVR